MKLKLLLLMMLFSVMSWGQASLPVSRTTWNAGEPTGWTTSGTGNRTTTSACSGSNGRIFDTTSDVTTVFFATTPEILTFKLKKQSISGAVSKMTVEESASGSAWTLIGDYGGSAPHTIITDCSDIVIPLLSTSRYIRWTYTKGTGNCDLDDISISSGSISPTITMSSATLSGMTYVLGTGPSTNQTFTASGSNLTNNIVLNAPTNYEISTTSSSGFGSTITLNHSAGVINATTIYVRLKAGLPVATYNGEIVTATSMGATAQNVTCNGSVTDVSGSNDLCSSATNLVVNAAATSSNMTGSTFTAPFTKKDVWYSFTPTCTGTHAVTVAGFTGDIDIELFSSSCPATTTTLDDSSGNTSTEATSTSLTSGITYYLRVLAFNTTAQTSAFTVQVSATSVLTLTNAGSPATGNISAGTANAIIMGFATTPTCATNYSITNVTLSKSTVSTVTTSDISNFRIFYDANGNGIIDGGETSVSGAGIGLGSSMTFNLAGQTGITVARRYLLVADVAPAAVNGNKIKINLTPNTDLVAALTPMGFGTGTALGSTQTISTPSCTAAVISSVTPASGPVGTEVTITGSSGNLAGATATFNGIAATVVSSTTTQLVVIVPTLATTGNLIITDGQPCNAITTFTVIDNDITSCQGVGNSFSDLIISEVYDSNGGNVWHMELFNPTNATIDLDAVGANYRLERFGTIGDATPTRTVDISGIILPGAVYLADLGTVTDPSCPKTYDFTAYAQGINASDAIKLTKEGVSVDIVHCPNEIGYTITRNPTAAGPSPTFNGTDWSTNLNETCADLGLFSATLNTPAGITAQPSLSLTCSSTSTSISVTATEGVVGGNSLAYQWYVAAPSALVWTALTNTGVYSGTTSNVLNISSLTGLNNYQYYCQVREDGLTCYQSTIAVKIMTGITTTWNGTAWSDGFPTLGATTIINGTYDMNTLPSFDVCSLIVNSPFVVTVTANKYINIQNDLTVTPGATLTVLNNGSLVQINNFGLNAGSISMKRTASIRKYDYVYWSSPVANFHVSGVSSGTSSGLIYKWNTTIANSNNGFGNWENANENMVGTKGYIIRGPNAFDNTTLQPLTAEFIGVANNGIYTPTISRGSYTGPDYQGTNGITVTKYDDNWNLVGNPYPSAIKALDFLNANLNLDGFVNLWTHGTLPGSTLNPFYGSYAYNYTANDYITFNGTGTTSGPSGFNGYIAAGQGFFVMMDDGAADVTQTITFNNSMRSKGYDNAQFYRISASTLVEGTEKHRIWLDLISSTNAVNRMLVGYVSGATLGRDRLYDAVTKVDNNQNFYSLLTSQAFKIQGRPVPFDTNDQVPLGVKLPASGSYTIALGATDGLFLGVAYPIFLEDKLLNIIHDLKQAPYSFTAVAGKFDNRFVLRYTNVNLGNDDFVITENHVAVATGNQEIVVKSQIEPIKNIAVYDVLGRLVFEKNNISTTEFTIRNIVPNQQSLIVRIALENGQTINRKIVF